MDHEAPLEQLAAQLYAAAKDITLFCHQQNHPQRSLDRIEPTTLLPKDAPHTLLLAQQNIKEAALRIQQLVTDPNDFLERWQVKIAYISRLPQYQQLACLRWIFRFNVLFHVPLQHSVTYETIASAAQVPLRQLKSIVRMATTMNLLREPIPGEVAHSSTSAAFIRDPSLSDLGDFLTSSAMMALHIVEATEKFGGKESATQTTFNVWKNTDKPFFDYLKQDKEMTRQFASYMKNRTSGRGLSIQHLLTGYDWAALGKVVVVDVGGSNGYASIALAEAFPNLQFIVQDLPATIESSRPDIETLPSSISSRLSFQPYDFFTPQPLKDVEIFLLRAILHDWPKPEATRIIRNLVDSMKPGGKLIIMDTVLPQPGSVPAITESVLRCRDLTMMEAHNSKERELDEWVDLLKGADERLRLQNVVQPFMSLTSVLEVVRDDDVVSTNGHINGKANGHHRS